LITGITGKQGKGVISNIDTIKFKVVGITRNPESAGAKALIEKYPNVRLVQGDYSDCDAMFKAAGESIWGVFSVQASGKQEEAQGKALIDAAVANDVKFFAYSSVDRGVNSNTDPTDVPHFIAKYNIEQYLKEKVQGKMSWFIVRPVAFMDNFEMGFLGKCFGVMWKGMGGTKLQIVSTKDIGYFVAQAFNGNEMFQNKAISIAGDELTFEEANSIFEKEIGYPMPITYDFIGTAIQWIMTDIGKMFQWFGDVGYAVDIPQTRQLNPNLQSFADWVKQSSHSKR